MSPSDAASLLLDGRFEEALQTIKHTKSLRQLTAAEDVLLAELLTLTGDTVSVITLAEQTVRQHGLTVNQRCRLRLVLGRSYFRTGESAKGLDHYSAGIALAEQHGELADECQLRVHLFRNQLNWLGPHLGGTELAA